MHVVVVGVAVDGLVAVSRVEWVVVRVGLGVQVRAILVLPLTCDT